MNGLEVRQIFLLVLQVYNDFQVTDEKVAVWADVLDDVPFELAQANFRTYIRQPENKFPPHPGALAVRPTQAADSRYVPNVEETRLMLERDREWKERAVPPPPELKAKIMQLAKGRMTNGN